jgi:hypothetical protein
MSVMRDDDSIQQPPDPRPLGQVTHLGDLVGRGVAYEQDDLDPRHGAIVSASYSLSGEMVLIVHPDSRPSEIPANTILMGHQASWALEHLDAPGEPLPVDAAACRRLNAEQAGTIPEVGLAPAPSVAR